MKPRPRKNYRKGINNGNARLTEAHVRAIRKRRAAGYSLASIAEDYRMHVSSICLIVARKRWGHVA